MRKSYCVVSPYAQTREQHNCWVTTCLGVIIYFRIHPEVDDSVRDIIYYSVLLLDCSLCVRPCSSVSGQYEIHRSTHILPLTPPPLMKNVT